MMLKILTRFTVTRSFCTRSQILRDDEIVKFSPVARTDVKRITDLNDSSLHKFHTIEKSAFNTCVAPILHPEHARLLRLFKDESLLVRKPLLEVVELLKKPFNPEMNVPRFVLYGLPGSGCSSIYAQLALFGIEQEAVVFNFANAESWIKRKKTADYTPSDEYHTNQHKGLSTGEIFDFPERSVNWLKSFLQSNQSVLEKKNLKLKKQVNWTRKDCSPVDTPWLELINFGIERSKYANDIIGILLREARSVSSQDNVKVFLMIDGVNLLWTRSTILRDFTLNKLIEIDRLAIVNHLKRALRGDWSSGAIICTTNVRCAWPTNRENSNPVYLLTQAGFEHLDPFIPVLVPKMEQTEFQTMLSFYAENRWLTRPEAFTEHGQAEMAFLSDMNFRELFSIAAEW